MVLVVTGRRVVVTRGFYKYIGEGMPFTPCAASLFLGSVTVHLNLQGAGARTDETRGA